MLLDINKHAWSIASSKGNIASNLNAEVKQSQPTYDSYSLCFLISKGL